MVLELKKFDMNCINFETGAPLIFIIGRRSTGKSVLVRDLLHHHKDVSMSTIVSETESVTSPFYVDIVPKSWIHDVYKPKIIENVLRRQKVVLKQIKAETKNGKSSSIDPRHIVVLDDCFYDHLWYKNKMMKLIFMQGIHWKTMLIITMQYPLGIPPDLRINVDYIFILKETSYSIRRRLYNYYASAIPSFEIFNDIMDNTTENFECLVINNRIRSTNLEGRLFWYKADHSIPDFKLGSNELLEISKEVSSPVVLEEV